MINAYEYKADYNIKSSGQTKHQDQLHNANMKWMQLQWSYSMQEVCNLWHEPTVHQVNEVLTQNRELQTKLRHAVNHKWREAMNQV